MTTHPKLTAAALLDRALALVPTLRERAAEAEALRQMPAETIAGLRASGLIRIGNPERYGGHGIDYDLMFEVAWELGRGCASTAWCYGVWTVHNWWVGHFPEQAQDEYFAAGPDVLASSAVAFSGTGQPAAGGYTVTGRWSFSSGCDAATWVFVGINTPDGPRWALLPRPGYQIVDTWHVTGMRGTGSKDIVAEGVFVPAHRTLNPAAAGDTDHTGWDLHHRPSYRAPMRAITGFDLAAPVIGAAQGAVDAFAANLGARAASGAPASAAAQLRLAESAAEVDAARALHRSDIREILTRAEAGGGFTDLDRARYTRDKAFIATLCAQAATRLAEAGGARTIYTPNPIARFHQDIQAALHHHTLSWDAAAEPYAQHAIDAARPS